jgi:hypothetical protein
MITFGSSAMLALGALSALANGLPTPQIANQMNDYDGLFAMW